MRDLYDLTDGESLNLFKTDNEWDFNKIYFRYYNCLCGYTTKHVRSKDDAEEITNTTLALTFKYLNNFRGKSSLSTWLYCILRNQICSYYRIIQRRGDAVTQSLDDDWGVMDVIDKNLPENQIIQREYIEHITAAVNKLPEVMKKTAQLYFIDELPIKVVAKMLNCREGTIRSRTHRIKRQLQIFLAHLM